MSAMEDVLDVYHREYDERYPVVYYLPSWQLQRDRLRHRLQQPFTDQLGNEITDPVSKVMAVVKSLIIIRIALMEAVAVLGLVSIFILIMQGSLPNKLSLLLFLAPTGIFLFFVLKTFPSKSMLIYLIQNRILNKIRV